ncbi:glycosyltransferase family 4 protein [Sphingobacterium athyrii]|uniref:Glycosyltransferase WbuB n=1 Tax=Sphingobacterium athyrii TaxID=2152717 RepID=A0A363NQK0_9SPHI|nr:glycosyltransferase family 4 protein [Sphingobacterium athyrii]PUV22941.1 glycosyltransferase WbuB [Sphingobacterium athyrii]
MNILYIHQYFKTPKQPGGTRSYWLAQELIKNGHCVTIVTAGDDDSLYDEEQEIIIDGIKVKYFNIRYSQSMSILARLKSFMAFIYKASLYSLKHKDIDLVFATSTPLTVGIPALLLKRFKRIPYIFEVRDLWPEVPIQMGALKNKFIRKLAVILEKTIYRNAKHVIALSPGMEDGVLKYISKDRTSMIPNMSKKDEFWPREKNLQKISDLGLDMDTFKVVHFGSLGLANGAHAIIESAKILAEDSTVEFLFVGGGATEHTLKEKVIEYGLNNVKFLGKFPMKDVSEIVNFSDVSIVSFLDLPILYTNSPNKLFDSLSAGKPIIVNSAGWTKELVEKFNCGFYVNPVQPVQLVEKIKYLQSNPSIVAEMGEKSRWLAENKYDKSILAKQFVEVIERVMK